MDAPAARPLVEPTTPDENKQLNHLEREAGALVLRSRPVRISMNLTGRCNIRCIYCHLTYADYFTKAEFTPELFARLAPVLPTLAHLVYFASTEPLAARHFKDVFRASMPYAAEKYLSTNGILIDRETAEMFVDGGLDFLTISFGGLTRGSFRHAHQVDALDTVTRNIETLNEIKRRRNSETPRLRLVFVTWKDNAHELPEAVRYAHRHAFSEGIKISYLKAYTDDLIDQIAFDHRDVVDARVAEAQALGAELGVPVGFDGGNFADFDEEIVCGFHRLCHEPYERFHVEADGTVRTCSTLVNSVVAGDLATDDVEAIWNGPVFQDFRRRVNTPEPPDVCRTCIHNVHRDINKRDVWDLRDRDLGIYNRLDGRSYLKGRHRRST